MLELILLFVFLFVALYAGHRLFLGGRNGDLLLPEDEEPRVSKVERYLRTLKLEAEPLLFVAAVFMVSLAVFLVFLELFPDAFAMAGLAGLALVVFAFSLLKDLSLWRARQFETKLVDAIDLMQASLQAGESPRQALRTTAEASKGLIRTEFEEVLRRLELGLPIERATSRMTGLYDTEGVRLFVQVLVAKWNMGGDLLLMLRSINRVIRDRIKLRLKINSQLSGARYSLFFVALIPYILIPVFLWKEPGWIDTLTSHRLGPTFLLAAILLQVAGFFWMRRILRIEK
jgi:Flp pilus assembly protein TadB